ncbi:unnamed protein product, partial [Didymodactylos carnosus]
IPVEFTRPLTDIEVEERTPTITLECECNKIVLVEWLRFATVLTPFTDENRIIIEQDEHVHRLIIKNVQMDDAATYTCRYSTDAQSSGKLRVTELPVAIVTPMTEEQTITENDDLVLTVELNKPNVQNIIWLKDGQVIDIDSPRFKRLVQGEKYSLKLVDSKLDDQGRYTCKIGDLLETSTVVHVNELPVYFTEQLKDRKILENSEQYHFDCEINKENKIATWYKDQEQIVSGDECRIAVNGRIHSLVFSTVQLKHQGQYTIKFDENITSTANLTVEDAPTDFDIGLENVQILECEPLILECILTKDRPDDEIKWFFDGEPLEIDHERIKVQKVGPIVKLTIDECKMTDEGRYMAEINGKTSKATVTVKEKPLKFVRELKDIEINEWDRCVFECELNKKDADCRWFKDTTELRHDVDNGRLIETDGKVRRLILEKVEIENEGDYGIVCNNQKSSAKLKVIELPYVFVTPLVDQEVVEKQQFLLECETNKTLKDNQCVWTRNGVVLTHNPVEGILVKTIDKVHSLTIYESKMKDAGRYVCTIKQSQSSCEVKIKVEFVRSLEGVTVTEGQPMKLSCTLSKENCDVKWYRDDDEEPIQVGGEEESRYSITNDGRIYRLEIKESKMDDAGKYTIKVEDKSQSCQAVVTEAPIDVVIPLRDQKCLENTKEFEFYVELNKPNVTNVVWKCDEEPIFNDEKYSITSKGTKYSLTIKNVSLEDEKMYSVQVGGTKAKSQADLTVEELEPDFVGTLTDVECFEDADGVFECELTKSKWKKTGLPIICRWYRNVEREVRPTVKYSIERSGPLHKLIVHRAAYEDDAEYRCVIGEKFISAKLTVNEIPVTFTQLLEDVTSIERETVTLQCEVSKTHSTRTESEIPIQWYRDGVKMVAGGRFEITKANKRQTLKIINLSLTDAGEYSCTAGGDKGAKTVANVIVGDLSVEFTQSLTDKTVLEDQTLTLDCTVNRTDKPYQWYFNDQQIHSGEKFELTKEKNKLKLIVKNAQIQDEGQYSCKVGDVSTRCKVVVDEEKVRFTERLTDVGTKEGEKAVFQCAVSKMAYVKAKRSVDIKWLHNQKPIENNEKYVLETNENVLKLTVNDVKTDDVGIISCFADDVTTMGKLLVEETPIFFVRKLQDQIVTEIPGMCIFECELNRPGVSVKWLYDKKELDHINERNEFHHTDTVYRLKLFNIDPTYQGEYVCVARDKKSQAFLKLQVPPTITQFQTNSKLIKRDQLLQIDVIYTGCPEPTLEWQFNGTPLKLSSRIKSKRLKYGHVQLTVDDTKRTDGGKYTVLLENEFGKEERDGTIEILDRPSKPRDLKAKVLDSNEVELEWTVPEDDGGSPLTGYCIEKCEERRAATWDEVSIMSADEKKTVVTRLLEGSKYQFRVSAENKYGRGDPNETEEALLIKSPFDPPAAPDAPLVDEITGTTCRVQWSPPSKDGGSPITSYIVERRLKGAARWTKATKQPIHDTTVTVEDLLEGSEYEFRVIAQNKVGPSQPSEPSPLILIKNPFDKPGAPRDLTIANIGKDFIELSWQPPQKDGGSPVTSYVIERRTPAVYKWHGPPDPIEGTSTTLRGLHTGSKYEFRVRAQNIAGLGEPSAPTKETEIKEPIIGEKPRFIQEIESITVVSGKPATFTARVKGDPQPDYKWTKGEKVVVKDAERLKFDVMGDTAKLIITECQAGDAGVYTLEATNPLGTIECNAKLVVQSPPVIVSSTQSPVNVTVNQGLYISCEIQGWPRAEATWTVNDEPVSDRARTEISDTFVALSISKTKKQEQGRYKLKLKNPAGEAQASFEVNVQDVPGLVQNLSIKDIQAEAATVTWLTPLDDGGTPITAYYVEYRDLRRSNFVRSERLSSDKLDYELSRLTKGSKYTVRVFAENKVGMSEPCELKEPFVAKNPFDVPGAPRDVKVGDVTKSSCQLHWSPPASDGGAPIQGYVVERQAEKRWVKATPTLIKGTSYNITDLIEGSIYEFRVSAVNEEGQGMHSRATESVTIKDPYGVPTVPGPIDINEVTDTTCTLTWKPPIRDGGSPVTSYVLEMRLKSDPTFTRCETAQPIIDCRYTVPELLTNSEYEFRVAAQNKAGLSPWSQTDHAIMIRKPKTGNAPQITKFINQTQMAGGQGKFEAVVTGEPQPECIWYKGGKKLNTEQATSRYTSSFAQGTVVLYIKEVEERDQGQYTLEAQNDFGNDSKQAQLTIHAVPKIEIDAKHKKQHIITIGSSLRVPFIYTGLPKPELTVAKADSGSENEVSDNVGRATLDIFENTGTFLLRQTTRSDTGFYRLHAKNENGSATARLEIVVQDVPSKPGEPLSITSVGKDHVGLQWQQSADDGGCPLVGYVIEKREDSKSVWSKVATTRPTNTAYTCTGLFDNVAYRFRVMAENDMGMSEPIETEQPVTAKLPYSRPSAPQGPVLVDDITQTSCKLSWLPSANDGGAKITAYIVEGKDVKRQAWTQLETLPSMETSTDIRNLKEDATYMFRIYAKNIAGISEPLEGEAVTLKRPKTVPGAPVPFLVSDIDIDSCTLEWEAPKFLGGDDMELKSYLIEQRIGDKDSWKTAAEPDAFAKFVAIKHLKEEKEYWFRIKAVNELGASKPTELTRPVIPRQKSSIPSAPTGPITPLMIQRDSITISWGPCRNDGGSELIGYVVEKRESTRNVWQRVGYNDASSFTCNVGSLTENLLYHFRVMAENTIGMSSPLETQEPILAKSPYTVPDKPEGPLTTKIMSPTSVAIAWNPPVNDGGTTLTGYLIQRRDVTRPIWIKAGHVSGETNRFTIKDLPEDASYHIQVFAENAEGSSVEPLQTEEPVNLVRKVDVPSAPAKIEVIAKTENSITVQWEAPRADGGSPVTEYLLDMREKRKTEWTQVQQMPAITTSFRITKLKEGTDYYFRVKAVNAQGEGPAQALEKAVKPQKHNEPPSMPGKPLETKNIDPTSILITWSPSKNSGSSDITGYVVEKRDALKAQWTQVRTTQSSQFSCVINDLVEGGGYFFRVRAQNDDGLSEGLELDMPVICKNPFDVPSPPRNLQVVEINLQTVKLQWDAPENDGGQPVRAYIIERRDAQRTGWIKETRCKTTTTEIENLPTGQHHMIRVTAENQEGQSAPCEIGPIQIDSKDLALPKPRDVEITKVKGQSLTLSWQSPVITDKTDQLKGFQIECWNSDEKSWYELDKVDAYETSYTKTDFKSDLSYQFRVRSLTKKGRSSPSRETQVLSLKRAAAPPDTPDSLAISDIADDSFTLSWRESTGRVKRYIIEKRESSKKVWVPVGESYESTIRVQHLLRGSNYEIRVFSENDQHERCVEPAVLSLYPFKGRQVPPALCEQFKVKQHGQTSFLVTWLPPIDTGNAPIKMYIIEKQQVGRLTWQRVNETQQCTCTVNELQAETQYKVRVAAVNEFGQGEFIESEPVTVIENVVPPSKPMNLSVTDISYSSITVSWLSPREIGSKPIKHYVLYQRSGKQHNEWKQVHRLNRTQYSYSFDNLDSGVNYWFRVTAESDAGESEPCDSQLLNTKKKQKPPPSPSHVFVRTIDDGQISLQWSEIDNAEESDIIGYVVEMLDIAGGDWHEVDRTNDTTRTCLIQGLKVGGEYSFRVSAFNRVGQGKTMEIDTPVYAKSPFSKPAVPGGPLQIANLTRSTADLQWAPPSTNTNVPIRSYFIEKLRDRIWVKVARLPSTTTSLKVFNLIENRECTFRVSAENQYGVSEPLESIKIKPSRTLETSPQVTCESAPVFEKLVDRSEFNFTLYQDSPPSTTWDMLKFDDIDEYLKTSW